MEWIRGDTIGHGSFGTVNLAIPTNQSPQVHTLMAVKSCGASHSDLLMKEKLILDEFKDCPEIINSFGHSFSFENGQKLYNVLLEYAPGGALADNLSILPESNVRTYTRSILKGLNFIHKSGYVHCDIKLQNLLHKNGTIKIADFGLAKKAGQKDVGLRYEIRGTPMYMSPEMVSGGEQESPADIWALGCAVTEMVTGAPAWRCRRESDIGGLLMRIGVGDEVPEIPTKLSEEGKDFLGKCFLKDPRKRWTVEMLLNHPFVYGHDDDYDNTVSFKDTLEIPTKSPRSAFDFPECMACSITSLSLPEYSLEDRLRELVTDQRPDWSVSDSWITVR